MYNNNNYHGNNNQGINYYVVSRYLENNRNDVINPNIRYDIDINSIDKVGKICNHEHYKLVESRTKFSYIKELCIITMYKVFENGKQIITINPISSIVYNNNNNHNNNQGNHVDINYVNIKKYGNNFISIDDGLTWYYTSQDYDEDGYILDDIYTEKEYLDSKTCDKIELISFDKLKGNNIYRYHIIENKIIEHNGFFYMRDGQTVSFMYPPEWCNINHI